MHPVSGILHCHPLIAALIGWFVAQGLKIPIHYLVERVWDWRRFFGSGGMPSSHTAMVVASSIMVYDATGVRRETGRQAEVINQILRDVLINGKPISDKELKELVGHKPVEVFGGFLVGLTVAGMYILYLTH